MFQNLYIHVKFILTQVLSERQGLPYNRFYSELWKKPQSRYIYVKYLHIILLQD